MALVFFESITMEKWTEKSIRVLLGGKLGWLLLQGILCVSVRDSAEIQYVMTFKGSV